MKTTKVLRNCAAAAGVAVAIFVSLPAVANADSSALGAVATFGVLGFLAVLFAVLTVAGLVAAWARKRRGDFRDNDRKRDSWPWQS